MTPIREIKNGKFGVEAIADFQLFQRPFTVFIDEGGSVEFAQNPPDYLNALPEHIISDLCAAAIRYRKTFLELVGELPGMFSEPRDILRAIYPSALIVPALSVDSAPVIHMELNCDWEPEHGMEWIIRADKVQYVGPFESENPLGDFTIKDDWNFA